MLLLRMCGTSNTANKWSSARERCGRRDALLRQHVCVSLLVTKLKNHKLIFYDRPTGGRDARTDIQRKLRLRREGRVAVRADSFCLLSFTLSFYMWVCGCSHFFYSLRLFSFFFCLRGTQLTDTHTFVSTALGFKQKIMYALSLWLCRCLKLPFRK